MNIECASSFLDKIAFGEQSSMMLRHYPLANSDSMNGNELFKKFPCPKCSSAFRQKGSLTRHIKYECDQPPKFKCPYCDHRFKKTSNAYEHVRRKHPDCDVFIENDSNQIVVLRPNTWNSFSK